MREAEADAGPEMPLRAPEASTESFEQVYRREGLRMVRVAFLIVGSQQQAERGPSSVGLGFDELTDALAALPVKRRAALVLRYYGDQSEAEIASALGVRPGTVKSLLYRGLAQLREVIER